MIIISGSPICPNTKHAPKKMPAGPHYNDSGWQTRMNPVWEK